MFSALRRRLTYTNVGVTLALFFSMSGGALAASHYLITSTKQIKPSVLSALKGKAGAAGANGVAGATGPAGPTGGPGAKGETGATGPQGSEGKEGPPGKNGTNGTTGFTATLPEGKTETGTWSFGDARTEGTEEYAAYTAWVPVSFNVPLASALEGTSVHFLAEHILSCVEPNEPARKECEESNKGVEEEQKENKEACPGSAAEPTAEPGNLCVYETLLNAAGAIRGSVVNAEHPFEAGAGTTGAELLLSVDTEGHVEENPETEVKVRVASAIATVAAYGTWAVTAPKKEM
jgi:hypothetical protein